MSKFQLILAFVLLALILIVGSGCKLMSGHRSNEDRFPVRIQVDYIHHIDEQSSIRATMLSM